MYDQIKMIPYERYVLSFSERCREAASTWILSTSDATGMSISEEEEPNEGGGDVGDDDDHDHDRDDIFEVFERDLRDLICSVGTLCGVKRSPWPDSTAFRIVLSTKTAGSTDDTDFLCRVAGAGSVEDGLSSATWFRVSSTIDRTEEVRRRIVYSTPNTGCQFHYQLL